MNETAAQEAKMGEQAGRAERMLSREKYWEECDADQKLDRLRDAVSRLCRDMTTLTANLQQIVAHRHGTDGELLTPFRVVDPYANHVGSALAGGLYAHDGGIPHNLRTERERR